MAGDLMYLLSYTHTHTLTPKTTLLTLPTSIRTNTRTSKEIMSDTENMIHKNTNYTLY